MRKRTDHHYTWREYQRKLKRDARKRYYLSRLPCLWLYGMGAFVVLVFMSYTGSKIFARLDEEAEVLSSPVVTEREERAPEPITKRDLREFLRGVDPQRLFNVGNGEFQREGISYTVETSLDMKLQGYALNLLSRSKTSRAAVVVLDPRTGKVLAMADHKGEGEGDVNLCLAADFPAASLFKIISAAAAIEVGGLSPEKTLLFRGRRHTLYKSQLTQKRGPYTVETTLRKAFASSINPVFGKIGIYYLGRELLTEYAKRFLFNGSIPFELPVGASYVEVPEDNYGLAEISSGFNKRTLISPLHGALIGSVIANNGVIVEPWIVSRIKQGPDKIHYENSVKTIGRAISDETATELRKMMRDTVLSGTGRKAFHRIRAKNRFKNIELGAKTGTVNDRFDRYKYDWMVAYALPKDGQGGICVSVLAVHGKKLGIRASQIARYIIDYYYRSTRRDV
ncbi:MAG: hypothetical protein JRH06_04655 [Deltaproteobacteria bacterium]|nr:hypothetical protein [Deltaproteobacteria bacterium]